MVYTTHGHHIRGSDYDSIRPEAIVRCGGPAICPQCSEEETAHNTKEYIMNDSTSNHRLSNGLVFASPRHPGTEYLGPHFAFGHLPWHLQEVSKRFALLAQYMVDSQEDGPELTVCLRKLWEAKNSAVLLAGFITDIKKSQKKTNL